MNNESNPGDGKRASRNFLNCIMFWKFLFSNSFRQREARWPWESWNFSAEPLQGCCENENWVVPFIPAEALWRRCWIKLWLKSHTLGEKQGLPPKIFRVAEWYHSFLGMWRKKKQRSICPRRDKRMTSQCRGLQTFHGKPLTCPQPASENLWSPQQDNQNYAVCIQKVDWGPQNIF